MRPEMRPEFPCPNTFQNRFQNHAGSGTHQQCDDSLNLHRHLILTFFPGTVDRAILLI